MATSRGAFDDGVITIRALSEKGAQDADPIPLRLIEAAQDLQAAYDRHIASRGTSARQWRRAPGNKNAALKRIERQLRLSRESLRVARARG